MDSTSLPSTAVLEELEKILSSNGFRNAGRSSRLLRFIIDETLNGHADRLKDYMLGAEALGRGGDFDPRTDPIAGSKRHGCAPVWSCTTPRTAHPIR
jgi:hypothetical protein